MNWPTSVRAVHWLTTLLIIVAIAAVLGHDVFDERATRSLVMNVHRQTGLVVLALTLLRLLIRTRGGRPVVAQAPLLRLASTGGHLMLYLCLLALPLLGWAYTNAHGSPVTLFGVTLPTLLSRDRDLAETLQEIHETVGWVLVGLIGAHMLAALWHHLIRKDNVLRSMLGRA